MDENMDEVALLNQMARFDFSKPIVVTIIFEEDEYLCNYEIETVDIHSQDCLNIAENSEMNDVEYNTVLNEVCQNDINVAVTKQKQKNTDNNLNIVNDTQIQINDADFTETGLDRRDNIECVNNPNSVMNTNSTNKLPRKTSITDSEIYQHLTDGDELNQDSQKQLDNMSDLLIRIMMPYYMYSNVEQRRNYLKLRKWDDIKIRYFNLSYNIVVDLILPREKNRIFVKKFLDRTVTRASNIYKWKFEPRHVEPFYNELIDWSKYRKEKENTRILQNVSKNLKSQTKVNDRKNPKMLKGNIANKKKIKKNTINNDKLVDNGINEIRNGINNMSFIEQIINNNSINQDKNNESINYNGINCNNACDFRIRDQRKEINNTNSINTRLINNEINVNGMHGTKDISNETYASVLVENALNNSNSINSRKNNTETDLNENNLINENRTLAERLVDPPQPLNFSHSTIAPIPSLNLNLNNSTCIFAGGSPGREISINISSDLLLDHVKKQQEIQKCKNPVNNRTQSKENHSLDPPNSQLAPRQVAKPCKNGLQPIRSDRSVQQSPNNKSYEPVRPSRPSRPPPPRSSNSSTPNILTSVPETNSHNTGETPNKTQMTDDQPQRNISAYSAPEHNNWNSRQMYSYNSQDDQHATTTTCSSSVTSCTSTSQSPNATTRRITGLCNFCGKLTYKICSKCNKVSYCSNICQALHNDYVARFKQKMSNK